MELKYYKNITLFLFQLIFDPESYNKRYPPVSSPNTSLAVEVNMDVAGINNIVDIKYLFIFITRSWFEIASIVSSVDMSIFRDSNLEQFSA